MIIIYTTNKTSRLSYIANHLFRHVLGTDYLLTDNQDDFLRHQDILINYSNKDLGKGVQIIPDGLLFEKGIHPVNDIKEAYWDSLFCFFLTKGGDIPFDLLAASFYLITRYEEYGSRELDIHSRYLPEASVLFRNKCLEIPLVDQWTYKLLDLFKVKGYDVSGINLRKYNVYNTFDIDLPFEFRNKGFLINAAGALKDVSRKDFSNLISRFRTLLHLQEDPYFKALMTIDKFHRETGHSYHLFILHGKYEKYGRRTIYPLRRYYRFLSQLKNVTVGLHPSYSASFDKDRIGKEKESLANILKRGIISTRQHYLRLHIPETFRQLEELRFTEDFSLAYSSQPGFRAGTSVPFHFYDLERDVSTSLLVRPTIVMDATLMSYLNLQPEEGLNKIKQLADSCSQVGGDFVMLWHNSNLSGSKQKNPWIDVFIEGCLYAISLENNNFANSSAL